MPPEVDDYDSPWGWVPSEWLDAAVQTPAPVDPTAAAPALQPGLGIPASMVDTVAAIAPNEVVIDEPMEAAPAPTLAPTPEQLDVAGGAPAKEWPHALFADDAMPAEEPVGTTGDDYELRDDFIGDIEIDPVDGLQEEAVQPFADDELELDAIDATPAGRDVALREDLAKLSDEQLLARKLEHDQAARAEALRRREEESLRNLEAQKANYRAREEADRLTQQRMDTLISEADRLSKTPPNPERWWSSRSTGQKVAAFVSAILGGLAAPSMGGRNVGLEQIRKNIDDDIAAQLADIQSQRTGLEMKRGAVRDQFAHSGDALMAAEQVRAASWQHVITQLETEQQSYDPRGTIAMQIEFAKRQARAAQAEAMRKYMTEEQKRQLEVIKVAQTDERLAEDRRAALEREKTQRYKIAVDAKQGDRRLAIDEKKLGPEIEKLNAEAQELREKGKVREAEKMMKMGVPGVTLPDGSTFVATAGSETGLENLRQRVSLTKHLAATVDALRRTRTGWTSKTGNSEENQRVRVLAEAIDFDIVQLQKLGVISAEDAPRVRGYRGFESPDQFKSYKAGIETFRSNVVEGTSQDLKAHGYPGAWELPDLQAEAAKLGVNDPATLNAMAADMEALSNDPKVPVQIREQASQWLQRFSSGGIGETAPTNPDYGKAVDEVHDPAPMPEGGGVDAAMREVPQ